MASSKYQKRSLDEFPLITVVLLDEIGLAETSPYNLLKFYIPYLNLVILRNFQMFPSSESVIGDLTILNRAELK
ncbi:441_t:CDS:2 [Dentiscutata erythropus]|uniref:441_t:CDS:1 n=1 Tax=Dentiscutata erythropus TaxID=1348616 RepID=A0A9N9F4K3_9GLOM|nr:441_t:CDS:2 [Dentiscutata erythropus]